MKYLIIIIFIFGIVVKQFAQIAPQVINSAGGGGAVGSSGVEVYYNIGEPIITTISNSNNVITQGFLQPDIVGNLDLSITTLHQNESCLNKNDGFISLVLNTAPSSAIQLKYIWSPSTLCPNQNCLTIDSLAPGNYSITVLGINSSSVVIDSVLFNYTVLPSTDPCQITVYNGFTPDGDGLNDNWLIENIENFPNNTVTIFNRWGNKLWATENYNNSSNVWDGKTQSGAVLTSGTYFYIIELENGTGIKKGWVELTGK
ncbi:MAG: gliding motility-associated C-terminal domain-containing protein [Bacteroidetes bacterium]|nr:gliding motility-associated C-terminal domain-containing protein [Bacteroidota bacterium]